MFSSSTVCPCFHENEDIFFNLGQCRMIIKIKINLHYTRSITPKRVISDGAHLAHLHKKHFFKSEETSLRWRALATLRPTRPVWKSNPTPTAVPHTYNDVSNHNANRPFRGRNVTEIINRSLTAVIDVTIE